MADILYTVRKVALPVNLLDKIREYFKRKGILKVKAHHIVNLCMEKLEAFDDLAVRVSDIVGYKDFLATVFSPQNERITLFFKPTYWEEILVFQNRLNIGAGDIVRLLLGSCLFSHGSIEFPLATLSKLFISERQSYQYNLVLPKSITELLVHVEKNILPINRGMLFRAAHCYFASSLGTIPKPIPEAHYLIDNATVGWSRITMSGSIAMKDFFLQEKNTSRTTLGIIMGHVIHSFLTDLKENNTHG